MKKTLLQQVGEELGFYPTPELLKQVGKEVKEIKRQSKQQRVQHKLQRRWHETKKSK